jgi:DNA-binding NarL/FixJ family response regulator
MSPPISIAVAQRTRMESELVSRALTARRRQFTVLACVLTAEELLKKVAEHRPEVTVISSCLQGDATAGLKVLRTLCASGMITHPIMLVDYSDSKLVTDAFAAGAKGVVCRDEPFESLCKCIQRVHAGQVWANSQQLHWILKSLAVREPIHVVSALGVPLLTRREEQIVQMVVECLPSGEIASKLGVSAHTVKNHLFRIYEKLGVSSRSELILYALSSRDGALQLKT